MGGGWKCLLGLQSQPGPAGALIPSSWSPGPGHTRLLAVLHAGLAPLVSSPSCIPFPWSAGPFPAQHTQRFSAPPVALHSPSPVPVSLLCTDPGEPGGVERSRRGYPSAAGRRAEDITWVSGLAGGGGARGRCRSLRSRRDLESSSQNQEPSWGWPNPQPVFFSFEMEPPSPDSRATS